MAVQIIWMPIVMWLPTWQHAGQQQPNATLHGHLPLYAVLAIALQTCDGSWACCVALQQVRGPQRPPRLSICDSCLLYPLRQRCKNQISPGPCILSSLYCLEWPAMPQTF